MGRPSNNCKLSDLHGCSLTPDAEPYRLCDHYSLAHQIGGAASGATEAQSCRVEK
jgi:hypothetical protein